ncbi:MAG: molecular chaperone DnaJ [Alphaproteobacteria bacterium]|nr:molecular chaperone DnaJ [Alphaproteobacteria bacterium]MCL2758072.1 molecular chaperone DnaJ [Alphaproteobacteria bacterium]
MKNPYEILGVPVGATDAEIKKAYHRLVLKYHPDKNSGDKAAEEKFKEVNNAFDILKDPQKRAAYDRFGASAFGAGNGASAGAGGFGGNPFGGGFSFGGDFGDMSEMMEEMLRSAGFGGMGAGRGSRRTRTDLRGRDLLHQVTVSLREAFTGKTETIKFSSNTKCEKCDGHGTADAKPAASCDKCFGTGYVRTRNGFFAMESPCPECHGAGRSIKKPCGACDAGVKNKQREIEVKIPAGTMDGMRLRLAGKGEAAPLGGSAGDFYIDVRVQPDKIFEREGDDLYMTAAVPFATLALGGEIEIDTIDDKKLSVKIPAGTQVHERMRMRTQGMPAARGGRGDLYLDIGTEVPKKLSEKQKRALEEFAGTEPKKKKGLF